MLYYITYITLYCIVLYRVVLYYIILYYIILYYIILYYIILSVTKDIFFQTSFYKILVDTLATLP